MYRRATSGMDFVEVLPGFYRDFKRLRSMSFEDFEVFGKDLALEVEESEHLGF